MSATSYSESESKETISEGKNDKNEESEPNKVFVDTDKNVNGSESYSHSLAIIHTNEDVGVFKTSSVGGTNTVGKKDHSNQRGAKKKAVRSIKKTAAALIAESSNEDEDYDASDSEASVSSGSESNRESASSYESNGPALLERKRTRSQMGITKQSSNVLRILRPRSVKVDESGDDYVRANEDEDSDEYNEDDENEDFQVQKMKKRVSSTPTSQARRGRPRKTTTRATAPENISVNLLSAPADVDSTIVKKAIDADDGSDLSLQSVSDIEQNNNGYNDISADADLPSDDVKANILPVLSTICQGPLPSHTLLSGIHQESAND